MIRFVRLFAALALPLVLWLAATELPATAAVNKRRFDTLVKQATAEFKAEQFQQALDHYREAFNLKADASLLFMIGRAQEELGDKEAALQSFRLCLASDPPAEIAGRAKEKIRVLGALLATGRLNLLVVPAGALASIDGQPIGAAPFAPQDLAPGTHTVDLTLNGYAASQQKVDVPGGGEVTVRIELQPAGKRSGKSQGSGHDGSGSGNTAGAGNATGSDGGTTTVTGEFQIRRGLSPLNWIFVGTGSALLAGGVGVLVKGFLDHGRLADQKKTDPSLSYKKASDLQNLGNLEKTLGIAFAGAGGALLTTGIILIFVPKRKVPVAHASADQVLDPQVEIAPLKGGAAVLLGGTF